MKHLSIIMAAATLLAATAVVAATPDVRKARRGIIVVDSACKTRAMEPFGGSSDGGSWYAKAVNSYRAALKPEVRLYCMVIPTAVEYYCPDTALAWTNPEKPVIDNIYSMLEDSVWAVDIHGVLDSHKHEDIYLRTDHHWAPLAAYYAAEEFARIADVPFAGLEQYDKRTLKGFVGTMYKFSRDISVRNAPEDFVYYVPRDIGYSTSYVAHKYIRRKKRRIMTVTEPFDGPFFIEHRDSSSTAYCTFMGGDVRTTTVSTDTRNGRRLMIVKDSYGNALPGYLFHSFEKIHVVDFRYFTRNIVDYAEQNGITDVLIVNNMIHAYSPSTSEAYMRLLRK